MMKMQSCQAYKENVNNIINNNICNSLIGMLFWFMTFVRSCQTTITPVINKVMRLQSCTEQFLQVRYVSINLGSVEHSPRNHLDILKLDLMIPLIRMSQSLYFLLHSIFQEVGVNKSSENIVFSYKNIRSQRFRFNDSNI